VPIPITTAIEENAAAAADKAAAVGRLPRYLLSSALAGAYVGVAIVLLLSVSAPLVAECHANLECRLADASLIRRYSLFVFEVVKAHAPASPRHPETIHYRGEGAFMVAGRSLNLRRLFKEQNL